MPRGQLLRGEDIHFICVNLPQLNDSVGGDNNVKKSCFELFNGIVARHIKKKKKNEIVPYFEKCVVSWSHFENHP